MYNCIRIVLFPSLRMQMTSERSSGIKLVEEPSFYPYFKVPKSPFEIRVRHVQSTIMMNNLHYDEHVSPIV